jgi:hypothetical protein
MIYLSLKNQEILFNDNPYDLISIFGDNYWLMMDEDVYLMVLMIESILSIEEGGESMANIAQKLMKLFLSVESVSLAESGIIVSDVLEDLLVEMVAEWRD